MGSGPCPAGGTLSPAELSSASPRTSGTGGWGGGVSLREARGLGWCWGQHRWGARLGPGRRGLALPSDLHRHGGVRVRRRPGEPPRECPSTRWPRPRVWRTVAPWAAGPDRAGPPSALLHTRLFCAVPCPGPQRLPRPPRAPRRPRPARTARPFWGEQLGHPRTCRHARRAWAGRAAWAPRPPGKACLPSAVLVPAGSTGNGVNTGWGPLPVRAQAPQLPRAPHALPLLPTSPGWGEGPGGSGW